MNSNELLVSKLKENGITDKEKMEKILEAMSDLINFETGGYYRTILPTLFKSVKEAYARVETKVERTKIANDLRTEYSTFCRKYHSCDKCPYYDNKFDCFGLFCYERGRKKI